MSRRFYLVSYDISDNKHRLKVMHLLEGYGERVQYSVFEIWATAEEVGKLAKQLKPHVKDEGSIRLYPLCGACVSAMEILGAGKPTDEPDLWIV